MTKETAPKPWSDLAHRRSLERRHRVAHLDGRIRSQMWRRAVADVEALGEAGVRAVMYIDNEYADLARFARRIYRAGQKAQKAGPK